MAGSLATFWSDTYNPYIVSNSTIPLSQRLRKWGWTFLVMRQKAMSKALSYLYGSPMQVLPAGHVGLAGALVLWVAQSGGRQMLFLRNTASTDSNARLTSFFGLGKHEDMAAAMRTSARTQLGETFCKSLKVQNITLDKIAAAPMFTYTDEQNGIVTPVQTLVWVMQVQAVQLELIELQPDHELVMVPEHTLRTTRPAHISPTHVAIWRSIMGHLPLKKLPTDSDAAAELDERRDADAKAEKPTRRQLH